MENNLEIILFVLLLVSSTVYMISIMSYKRDNKRRKKREEEMLKQVMTDVIEYLKEKESHSRVSIIGNAIINNGGKIPTKEIYDLMLELNLDEKGKFVGSSIARKMLMEFRENHSNVFTEKELKNNKL